MCAGFIPEDLPKRARSSAAVDIGRVMRHWPKCRIKRTSDLAARRTVKALKGMVGHEGESSNPLIDTLLEWNEYLEKNIPDFGGPPT
jgi:hypothetical protein